MRFARESRHVSGAFVWPIVRHRMDGAFHGKDLRGSEPAESARASATIAFVETHRSCDGRCLCLGIRLTFANFVEPGRGLNDLPGSGRT